MSSEAELFVRLAEDRLRRRTLWAGAVMLVSLLVPYEVIQNQPQFLWQLFTELPLSGVIAGLVPAIAGIVIIVAGKLCKAPSSLAIAVLAALLTAWLCQRLGSDAAAWGLLPLPQSVTGRAPAALVALALTAGGANLAFRERTRKAARVLLWAALAAAIFFYAWPGRGEAPGATVFRSLSVIGELPTIHFKLGAITLAVVALWPAIIALLGLVHTVRPPQRSFSALGMVALFGFPLVLMFLLFSWFLRGGAGAGLFGALGTALELSAVLALLAGSFEVLGESVFSSGELSEAAAPGEHASEASATEAHIERASEDAEREMEGRIGWPPPRAAAAALAVMATLATLQWWLARPPPKGIQWSLDAPSQAADELFGKLIPTWSSRRSWWDMRVRKDSSAAALLEVKSHGRAMIAAAEKVNPELGKSLRALARAATRLDGSARGWYRLVAEVNAACRQAKLPYYLDPQVSIRHTKEGLRRHLRVASLRVVRVRNFTANDEPYATLFVRSLGQPHSGHRLGYLGFSRDTQPFALVVLDTIDRHSKELRGYTTAEPPSCGRSFDPLRKNTLQRCGAMLATINQALGDKLAQAEANNTARHELQHQIDGPLLTLAAPVLRKLAAYTNEAQERVNRELSAYLAELANGEGPPKLVLVTPLRFALINDRGTYHHASVLLFGALAGKRLHDMGEVDAEALSEVFDELRKLDDDALRGRAAKAWEELFDNELLMVRPNGDELAPASTAAPAAAAPDNTAARPAGLLDDTTAPTSEPAEADER